MIPVSLILILSCPRFVLIQKTRGSIGKPNPEEELRLLEEKACLFRFLRFSSFFSPG